MSSSDIQAEPGPSRQPTISTEAEEQAAEAGLSAEQALSATVPAQGVTSVNGETGVNGAKVQNASTAQADADEAVKPENQEQVKDPNALPDEACETLYIQNLNEKVQIPGMSPFLVGTFWNRVRPRENGDEIGGRCHDGWRFISGGIGMP